MHLAVDTKVVHQALEKEILVSTAGDKITLGKVATEHVTGSEGKRTLGEFFAVKVDGGGRTVQFDTNTRPGVDRNGRCRGYAEGLAFVPGNQDEFTSLVRELQIKTLGVARPEIK